MDDLDLDSKQEVGDSINPICFCVSKRF